MTEVLQSPSHFPSPPTSSTPNDVSLQHALISTAIVEQEQQEGENGAPRETNENDREGDQLSLLTLLVAAFRRSLIGCSLTGSEELCSMEIGVPTNVRHVAHVTFDRFNGFLGLPDEFEPEVSRRAPSASANVFGVSTESMQLSFDARGNCVPTILLMMQRRLYAQGGLQAEGIFRINAENGQEEYVRDQLNRGVVPDDVDVHCLAGLIKAWFRELPTGILDSLSPEQVMQSQSEEECTQLVRLLPPTEAALLDWAVNLMADVAQLEHVNKMNARNVAVVFAPNMTQMEDPLTALMYAVQVMNFLKSLIIRTLREREDFVIEPSPVSRVEPSDENGHHSPSQPIVEDIKEEDSEEEIVFVIQEPVLESPPHLTQDESTAENGSQNFPTSVEGIILAGSWSLVDSCPWEVISQVNSVVDRCVREFGSQGISRSNNLLEGGVTVNSGRGETGKRRSLQYGNLNLKLKVFEQPMVRETGPLEKIRGTSIVGLINSRTELVEVWR